MSKAKEYLERIGKHDKAIEKKLDELTSLDSLVKRVTPVMNTTGASCGGNQDKLGDAIAKIVDLRKEVNRDVDILVDMKREAYHILRKLKNEEHYKVLEMRYLQYMSFEQIAVNINRSKRWAEKLHGRALQAFGKVLEEGRRQMDEQIEP